MAKIDRNAALSGLHGKIGGIVYKQYGDKTVASKVPVFTQPWSNPQIAHRSRMKAASAYADTVMQDPVAHAYYASRIPRRKKKKVSVRNAAISDFFSQPKIAEIEVRAARDATGAQVHCEVQDRWGVVGVAVTLRTTAGSVLEEGAATASLLGWSYTFVQPLPTDNSWEIEIAAVDRAGNRATAIRAAIPTAGR